MNVLLVEDEEASGSEFIDELGAASESSVVTWVRSRDEASERLDQTAVDFVVCDLRIPPRPASADLSENYGLQVHAKLRAEHPGIPSVFLTGYADSVDLRNHLTQAPSEDLFGTRELYPLVQLFYKDELRECVAAIAEVASELDNLLEIEMVPAGIDETLGEARSRVLRIYARRNRGVKIEIVQLGGLSGGSALRAVIRESSDQVCARVFAKLGDRAKLLQERSRFTQHVPPLLPPGSYPPVADSVEAGTRDEVGLFFGLAAGYERDFFSALTDKGDDAVPIVESLKTLLEPWRALRRVQRADLEDLSATSIDRTAVEELVGSSVEMLDPRLWDRKYEVVATPQHGDLHGENILLNAMDQPMLIDFALTGSLPACLDPIALELSLLFHPGSPMRDMTWPTIAEAEGWFNVDEYVRTCPFPNVVRSLRVWALDDAGDLGAVTAVVLANALRQLKYADTNKERARTIAAAAAQQLLSAS